MTTTAPPPASDATSPEQLLEQVRHFVADVVDPAVEEIERTREVPEAVLSRAADLGLFGLTIPREYGGHGLGLADKCRLEEVLGGAHYGFATVLGNHNGVGTAGLVQRATPAQRDRYLPAMARGDVRGVFCLTEPDAGSDAASVATTAERVAGGWVLNGHKTLITQAKVGGLFTVIARSDEGLSSFLVERDNPGLHVGDDIAILGLRGSTVSTVDLVDCRVDDDAVLGVLGRGLSQALGMLNQGRTAMSARVLGLGQRAFDETVRYANERRQFDRRLIDNQGLAWRLADLATRLTAARALLYAAADGLDAGRRDHTAVSMAKYYVTETVGDVVDQAVQVHGGIGYTDRAPAERWFRDARVTRIYEGSSEMHLDVIARTLTESSRPRG